MKKILVTDQLSIKHFEPTHEKDLWLIHRLEQDKLVSGPEGYLWNGQYVRRSFQYLDNFSWYEAPFIIYSSESPIGYLETSSVFYGLHSNSNVDLSYALIEEARGYGHMTKIIKKFSDEILMDPVEGVGYVLAIIDPQNMASQMVVKRAGFQIDGLSDNEHENQGYIKFFKTKEMIKTKR